jgi:hypothetical protein
VYLFVDLWDLSIHVASRTQCTLGSTLHMIVLDYLCIKIREELCLESNMSLELVSRLCWCFLLSMDDSTMLRLLFVLSMDLENGL